MRGSNEYKMKQSFWVPQPCFDPLNKHAYLKKDVIESDGVAHGQHYILE
jgi:hypothetical protein